MDSFTSFFIPLLSISVGLAGLVFAAYDQMSPKALAGKLKALEELGQRLPPNEKIPSSNATKPLLIDSFIDRYTALRQQADWSVAAGWAKRLSLFTMGVLPVGLYCIGTALIFSFELSPWWPFHILIGLILLPLLTIWWTAASVKRTMKKKGLSIPDRNAEAQRFLARISNLPSPPSPQLARVEQSSMPRLPQGGVISKNGLPIVLALLGIVLLKRQK